MISLAIVSLFVSAGVGVATPTGRPLPLVIWHGLGGFSFRSLRKV